MRALNIIGLALVFVMLFVIGYYINEVPTQVVFLFGFDYLYPSSGVGAITTEAVMFMLYLSYSTQLPTSQTL